MLRCHIDFSCCLSPSTHHLCRETILRLSIAGAVEAACQYGRPPVTGSAWRRPDSAPSLSVPASRRGRPVRASPASHPGPVPGCGPAGVRFAVRRRRCPCAASAIRPFPASPACRRSSPGGCDRVAVRLRAVGHHALDREPLRFGGEVGLYPVQLHRKHDVTRPPFVARPPGQDRVPVGHIPGPQKHVLRGLDRRPRAQRRDHRLHAIDPGAPRGGLGCCFGRLFFFRNGKSPVLVRKSAENGGKQLNVRLVVRSIKTNTY